MPRADPPLTGWGDGSEALSAYAVSADEIWANGEHTWFRLRAGAWEELGPGSPYCLSIVATDGALWTASETGALARISSDAGYRFGAYGGVECGGWGAYNRAGPDGSVLGLQDGEVVQYWPDGRRESIGRPQSVDPPPDEYGADFADKICLHGVDPNGKVWVSEFSAADDEECTAGTWHRWDGQRWHAADEPDPSTSAQEKVVAGDGIGWVLRGVGGYPVTGTEIARYAEGELVSVATRPRLAYLTAVSGGRACAFEYGEVSSIDASDIVCFDADGEFARYDIAGYAGYPSQYSVAPDGSVWLLGPQVVRLAERLPEP